jgi:hypothetical protein
MTETISHSNSLNAEQEGYEQSLGRRQVQMIAIGGAIGTGLFLGSASGLHSTGPANRWSCTPANRAPAGQPAGTADSACRRASCS